ncbi:hypothetical protein ACFL3C_00155 [Patescibacteria group bacterium]
MADTDNKMGINPESGKEGIKTVEKPQVRESDGREVEKAKVSVDLGGLETSEGAEAAEASSDKVSEKESKAKDQYTGAGTGGTQDQSAATILKPLPPTKVMKSQVKHELKREIKDLHKKIKKVMNKKGTVEAHQLNTLMAQLRRLREMLASLAHATADLIKDLWMRFVKEKQS